MVSQFKFMTVAALVAVCSVQVSGKGSSRPSKPKPKPGRPKPSRPSKTTECNPDVFPAATCTDVSLYKYCDDDWKVWVTGTMDSDMTCDANNEVVDFSSASVVARGPAAMALGVGVAIWQFM
ncbi:hypothetical protein H4S07_006902 [Coemansia furcata]|uniref:Uncharacterized protein n=1 Tax=Coemansia furcata TaxID=417177 RepID=A0ACC1KST1_9FUNG|nr:hypothetical protein H4S07_006902 [Coemansia furcata]